MANPPLIAVFGPTGAGKTAVALALGERLRARGERPVAISVDALQVYAGLELLTGAPSPDERARLEHRLVGSVPLSATHSAGAHAALAQAAIDEAITGGRRAIVVGGTGLYLQAALCALDLRPPPAAGSRERWTRALERRGVTALHAELAAREPDAAAALHPHDRQRVVRALELLDDDRRPPALGAPGLWTAALRHPTLLCGLVLERSALYARINARVDAIVAAGAIAEVARADASGASATARQAIGFRELLDGDVEAMRRRTRRYAKRQLSWMGRLPDVTVLDVTARDPDAVAQAILGLADARTRPAPDPAASGD